MRTTHVLAVTLLLLCVVALGSAGCDSLASVSVPQETSMPRSGGAGDAVFPLPSAKPVVTGAVKDLYAAKCASCHGATGDGKGPSATNLTPKPTNFTDAPLMREKTPLEFYTAITVGESVMPAHRVVMTLEERWGLVFHVRAFGRGAGDLDKGQALYRENCSVCHGIRGLGWYDGPEPGLARHLEPMPRNFNEFAWMADKPDQRLFTSISEGRTWTAMPAWSGVLSEADRWILVNYLRTFTYTP